MMITALVSRASHATSTTSIHTQLPLDDANDTGCQSCDHDSDLGAQRRLVQDSTNNNRTAEHSPFDSDHHSKQPRHASHHLLVRFLWLAIPTDDTIYDDSDSVTTTTASALSRVPPVSQPTLSPFHPSRSIDTPIVGEEGTESEEDGAGVHYIMAHATAVETAPNSPPELSYSKSSKSSSSSMRSSSIDDRDDDSATDSPHFEELSLDEIGRVSIDSHTIVEDNNLKPESRPTLRRPQSRVSPPYTNAAQNSSQYFSPQHLTSSRQSSPTGGVNGHPHDRPFNPPPGRMMRRNFMSRSTPEINTYLAQRRRSDTYNYQPGSAPMSPASLGSTTPRASQDGGQAPPAHMLRRRSGQAARKTVKELEAEYNDDDEDVPEEAILENVPISPMPGMLLQPESRTPSPRRAPLSPSYTNLHSAKVPKNARRPSGPPARSPRSPHMRRPPMLQHSNTVGAFPPEQPQLHIRKHRSTSWNDDLNDEARQLSAALEEYAENMSHTPTANSAVSSRSTSPRRQSAAGSRKTSVASVLELPPVQKGDIMIDPLPVSKEKEAVLTRTRPSWLPPKSQKEEKKHLKEWQQIMARAAAAEKKRVAKEKEALEQREGMQLGIESVWEYDILVHWETAKNEPRTKDLCWQGVAPISRGAVWSRAIGNELSLSTTSFQAALNRARALEERLDGLPAEELSRSKEAAWFSAIERDVPSAYPALNKFAAGTPASQALSDVLKAYAMYRSDVGYVYGTHLVAALLCLNMRPADAFITMANMLNRPIPLAFLIHDQNAMAKAHALVLKALRRRHSKLHAHLTSAALDLMPEEYLDPLFRCLFAYNLTVPEVSRLWDVYAFEGDQVLVHAAVAILSLLEPKLYGSKREVVELIGWRNLKCWDLGDEAFIARLRDVMS